MAGGGGTAGPRGVERGDGDAAAAALVFVGVMEAARLVLLAATSAAVALSGVTAAALAVGAAEVAGGSVAIVGVASPPEVNNFPAPEGVLTSASSTSIGSADDSSTTPDAAVAAAAGTSPLGFFLGLLDVPPRLFLFLPFFFPMVAVQSRFYL